MSIDTYHLMGWSWSTSVSYSGDSECRYVSSYGGVLGPQVYCTQEAVSISNTYHYYLMGGRGVRRGKVGLRGL